MQDIFPVLILIGRPASGKSEIIEYLRRLAPEVRGRRFHLGELEVIDDFPLLWAWLEEGELLSLRLDEPRLHTDPDGYFQHPYFWNLLVERLNLEYRKRLAAGPAGPAATTTLIEFARGSEHGGYREALRHFDADLLAEAAILYVRVSFEESLRKNRRRFNPVSPGSILEHAVPDNKLERLYREDDWAELSTPDPGHIRVGTCAIPFAVFENEDNATTHMSSALGTRLEAVLGRLWEMRGDEGSRADRTR